MVTGPCRAPTRSRRLFQLSDAGRVTSRQAKNQDGNVSGRGRGQEGTSRRVHGHRQPLSLVLRRSGRRRPTWGDGPILGRGPSEGARCLPRRPRVCAQVLGRPMFLVVSFLPHVGGRRRRQGDFQSQ